MHFLPSRSSSLILCITFPFILLLLFLLQCIVLDVNARPLLPSTHASGGPGPMEQQIEQQAGPPRGPSRGRSAPVYLKREYHEAGTNKLLIRPTNAPVQKDQPEQWTLYILSKSFRAERRKNGGLLASENWKIDPVDTRSSVLGDLHFSSYDQMTSMTTALSQITNIRTLQEKLNNRSIKNNLEFIQGIVDYLVLKQTEIFGHEQGDIAGGGSSAQLAEVQKELRDLCKKMKEFGFDGLFPQN
ncbi:hypothetical protein F5890DRAFT_908234 [Lentinula detonsa]|uniref:Uncharacterized protein n=1 Tax=Lentinula detonsa TaxID=2804962 RepID=A0AA38Q4W3_9AGAR|nr:hypothetical protein F5890DRAFT_908234 [Lentinula detonsa]